jgi:molybdate transport system permease protein
MSRSEVVEPRCKRSTRVSVASWKTCVATGGAFEAVDPGLEDVARLLGRGELSVFGAVTLPLAWRGLAAGVALAFARALGDFGATMMVAGNIPGLTRTASLAIYDAVQEGDSARAAWLTLWISLISIAALGFVQRTLPRAERRP